MLASLAASPREGDGSKPCLDALPTFPASEVDGVFIEEGYLFLECVLDRIVDDFGENSLSPAASWRRTSAGLPSRL